MKLHTIARAIAALLLSFGALTALAGVASADDPDQAFHPPYCIEP
ncbi:hypothetical protein [Lentzea jiangxiensis]|uniref:Uncharacterized protein n=1 Tax=Lentzea jiangxiensis TaxID=641025 RepID=A0A1H0TS24_9PSEU|nr:hypothetical protein [Lentzea jiangxiensis]SDP56759.1 hypothetical protein SAMN05421507_110189 [Lentzea jiangxiensis]